MDTDVIIIGAGAAGLAAAKELQKNGISFILLEASHRIGGRAYSEEIAPNLWFDLGCEYMLVGNDETQIDESNPFIDFAKKQGIEVEEYLYGERYYNNKKELDTSEAEARNHYIQECEMAIKNAAVDGQDCAISDIIDLENPYFMAYNDLMSVTAPKDLDEISVADRHYGVEEYSEYITRHGYGNIVSNWGRDIKVSLNTKVEKVNWSGKKVIAETSKGSIRAKSIISTVSNGILASQQIDFSPRLPEWKVEAIQGITMGAENKIGVHFSKQVFGLEDSGYYQLWSDDGQGAFVEVNILNKNMVTVFMGGRFSEWMEKQGQLASQDFAEERIADIFGNDIRKSVGRCIVTAWHTDPWTLGSYACALPGQYKQREPLRRSIDGKLYFAGEATARAHGTCNGAYWSGVRAATEVLETLSKKHGLGK